MIRIAILAGVWASIVAMLPGAGAAQIATSGIHIAQVELPQIPNVPKGGALNAPATPIITKPKAGALVSSPITIEGTTSPNAQVTVTAKLSAAVPLTTVQQKVGEATTEADDKGKWTVKLSYHIVLKIANAQLILESVAKNPLTGTKSEAAHVVVKIK